MVGICIQVVLIKVNGVFGLNFSRAVLVVLLVGLLLFVPDSVWARSDPLELQWSKTYENYLGASMIQTLDGGFLLTRVNTTTSS